MDYWCSTKSPRNMFRHAGDTTEMECFIRATYGVDPIILAAEKGIKPYEIVAYQRRLGLRPFTGNPKRKLRDANQR